MLPACFVHALSMPAGVCLQLYACFVFVLCMSLASECFLLVWCMRLAVYACAADVAAAHDAGSRGQALVVCMRGLAACFGVRSSGSYHNTGRYRAFLGCDGSLEWIWSAMHAGLLHGIVAGKH